MRLVRLERDLILLLPGGYAACEAPIVALGGEGVATDGPLP
jgi:hypothetical protein